MRPSSWTALLLAMASLALVVAPGRAMRLHAPRRVGPSHAPAAARSARLSPAPSLSNASSTDTPVWTCIRWNESRDTYSEPGGGAYQFQGPAFEKATHLTLPAEDYSPAVQDWAALKVYAQAVRIWGDGWLPWRADWGVCGLH